MSKTRKPYQGKRKPADQAGGAAGKLIAWTDGVGQWVNYEVGTVVGLPGHWFLRDGNRFTVTDGEDLNGPLTQVSGQTVYEHELDRANRKGNSFSMREFVYLRAEAVAQSMLEKSSG